MSEDAHRRDDPRRREDAHRREDDSGQALPLVVQFVVIVTMICLATAAVGRVAIERADVQAAADAVALAGAADGTAAAEVAAANGVELTGVSTRRGRTDVTVSRIAGSAAVIEASASARRVSGRPVDGVGRRDNLAPAMLAALARADQILGRPVPITSGYRSPEHQQRLWDNRHRNPYPVARPGTSRHEKGLAVDVPSWFVPRLLRIAERAGLCRPLPRTDPIHFEICRS